MRFELKLAWKYFRMRRRSLARFTSAVAVIGIACGVASLIVGQAISRGFASEFQKKILSNTPHVLVFRANGEISDWRIIKREIEKIENVREVSPTTYDSAVIATETSTNYTILRAVQDLRFNKRESNNANAAIEISIGAELADKANLKIGDEAQIIVPQKENTPKSVRVRIADVFRTGVYDYDSTWIYIAPEDLRHIQEKNDYAPTSLNVSINDVYRADETAEKIRAALPPDFKVLDWQRANQPLFAALDLERRASLAIISLIIFIAVLNITTTLALLVNERKLDIAILRTCGARTANLVFLFLLEGLLLALTGIFGGVIFGLIATSAANYFHLINLPKEIYSLSYVRLTPSFQDVLLIVAVAFALSLAATVYPAWRAAKIKPLENLRNS